MIKKQNEENIVDNKELDKVFSGATIKREQVWIHCIPQQQKQDFAIACYETTDP